MARALRAWAINRRGKNAGRNLQYGPRTRLVRGIYYVIYFYSSMPLVSFAKCFGKKTLEQSVLQHSDH